MNESHNCSVQDLRLLPRHIAAGLRERCPVRHVGPPLAPSRNGTALGGQRRPMDQTGRPAKYDSRIGTTALAAHKISHRVQNTCYCVSHPTICRPHIASGSSAEPRMLWTPVILPSRTNSVERTS